MLITPQFFKKGNWKVLTYDPGIPFLGTYSKITHFCPHENYTWIFTKSDMSKWINKMWIAIQLSIVKQLKRMKYWYTLQHKWN